VFSSLGLYPTMSGANFLAVSSPQFPAATVRAPQGELRITAPGASDTNRYIQSVKLGTTNLTRNWVNWSDIAAGGTLAHNVGSKPSAWGTAVDDQPPSVNQAAPDPRRHVDASLRPASAALPAGGSRGETLKFTVDVVAQAPATIGTTVTATAPPGWTVTVRPAQPEYLVSSHKPVATTATVTVKTPPGLADGSYPIEVSVSATGLPTVKRTASVTVRPPVPCASGIAGVCAVDLAGERTVDGTATVAQPAQGNFDGGGWSYDADLLPPAGPVTWAGTAYLAPDPTGEAKNFVKATGQSLLVTPAAHGSAKLVATTHDGPVTGTVTLGYADGSTSSATVTVADWCGTAAAGTTSLLDMPHRIKAGKGEDGPPVSLFGVTLPLTAGKQLRSITLPKDPRLHLYAVSLD
jgi:hypothetical protein